MKQDRVYSVHILEMIGNIEELTALADLDRQDKDIEGEE